MSQNDQSENVPSEGEKANVAEEPAERAPQIQEVRNPEPVHQDAQQQQLVRSSNTTPRQPLIMCQPQGTTFIHQANSAPPTQLIPHGAVPNVQMNMPPPRNVAFPSLYAQPGQLFNAKHAALPEPVFKLVHVQHGHAWTPQSAQPGQTSNPQSAQLGKVLNPQFGASENAVSWPGHDANPDRHSTSQERSKNKNVPSYTRPTLTQQRRGSVRGLTRSQHCASGKYQLLDVIYKIVPVGTVVLNGPMNVETACFHRTLPKEGKSNSIQITNPIEMFSLPDNLNNKVMSNPTIVNGPVNIKHLQLCDDMKSQQCIKLGQVDLKTQNTPPETVIYRSDATTNTSLDVNDVSCQTNSAQEDTQKQNQQKSIDDRRVRDETFTQMTFAKKVTSKPDVSVAKSSAHQSVRLEAVVELNKSRETALKVEKVALGAILKPEKLQVKKTPKPTDASTNTLLDVNEVSKQTETAQEDTQEQNQHESIDDDVHDETRTHMAFAARVASKPVSSLKVKKGVTKAIQKPEKLPIEKAPPSFKWNPIPSDLPAVLAQDWTQVGSSTSDDRAPSCSTSPVNNPWVEYLAAKEQSVDKCDLHVKGHADLRSPKPKDTEVSSDSENVPLEVKIDDDKVEDDKVDNVAKPELPTVAQKKAQEKAEFEEALATTRTNDRLIESCKLYIKAHHIIRQALHCVRAVSVADSVVTDGYQRMLLEFFTSKPKAYWADNHHEIETRAKHFINELKTSHGQNTPKDKDVRLKCDILLENMNDVIAQDLFCINDTYHENALEEIENNYLEVVFNPWGKLPTLFDFRDKLDTKLRKIMNGPAWSPRAVQESLDKYIGRQHTIRALPVGSNIQYKNDMEKDLHLQYSIHKAEFDRKLAEDREGLIANYLKFWRWQQKVVMDSLPKFQNRRVAILLLLFELMTTCSLEYPTELDKKIDVVLFDAQALEAKYNEYYLLKTPFGVTEHSKDYTMLLFDVRVSVRREEFAEDVQALVEDGQVPVEDCQAPAGEDQVQVEGSQAQEEDREAPAGESQAQEDDGEAPLGDSPAPIGE